MKHGALSAMKIKLPALKLMCNVFGDIATYTVRYIAHRAANISETENLWPNDFVRYTLCLLTGDLVLSALYSHAKRPRSMAVTTTGLVTANIYPKMQRALVHVVSNSWKCAVVVDASIVRQFFVALPLRRNNMHSSNKHGNSLDSRVESSFCTVRVFAISSYE